MANHFDSQHEEDFAELIGDIKAAGEVPEPSPLFWNDLSARVRDAVAEEPIDRACPPPPGADATAPSTTAPESAAPQLRRGRAR